MDKVALVEDRIKAGRGLIKALERNGFPVDAALWYYYADADEWRLIIASPVVDSDGPIASYQRVSEVLGSHHLNVDLSEVALVKKDDPLIKTLRRAVSPVPGLIGVRFHRNVIGQEFIEDALIYKL